MANTDNDKELNNREITPDSYNKRSDPDKKKKTSDDGLEFDFKGGREGRERKSSGNSGSGSNGSGGSRPKKPAPVDARVKPRREPDKNGPLELRETIVVSADKNNPGPKFKPVDGSKTDKQSDKQSKERVVTSDAQPAAKSSDKSDPQGADKAGSGQKKDNRNTGGKNQNKKSGGKNKKNGAKTSNKHNSGNSGKQNAGNSGKQKSGAGNDGKKADPEKKTADTDVKTDVKADVKQDVKPDEKTDAVRDVKTDEVRSGGVSEAADGGEKPAAPKKRYGLDASELRRRTLYNLELSEEDKAKLSDTASVNVKSYGLKLTMQMDKISETTRKKYSGNSESLNSLSEGSTTPLRIAFITAKAKRAAGKIKETAASAAAAVKNGTILPGKKSGEGDAGMEASGDIAMSAKKKSTSNGAVKGSDSKSGAKKNGSGQAAAKKNGSAKSGSGKSSGSGSSAAKKSAVAGNTTKKPSGKNAKKKKIKKKRSKPVIFIRSFIFTLLILFLLGGLGAAGYTAYVISTAPTIHPERIYDTLDVSTHIYDDHERLVDEIYYNENRQITSYEELPDNLKNAFIAVEDKTFWKHKGFNFKRIIGAILEKLHGGRISGTSTITQQLARNVFLPDEKSVRSIKRKIIEMYYAYEIEQALSKEEILTAYLNTIYLGYGCYGVDTAARTYFSCSVEDLTLEQCAALAALPQAPGSYALIVTEEGENTTELKNGLYANDTSESRRNMILGMMEEQGYITAEEREAATKPLAEFIKPGSTAGAASKSAFKDYLIETIKKDLMREYDIDEQQAINIIYTKGLNIYSTMDSQAQDVITKEFKKKKNFPSATKKGVDVEAAMVVVDIKTGQVKAMVGTRQSEGEMLFNRATNPRQPGSSIKPISVYAPALQKSYEYEKNGDTFKFKKTGYDSQGTSGWGDYITASSLVVDEKMTVNGETWPKNVTRSYSGRQTFRTALQKSINTCAVKILSQVGIEYSMDMVQNFGITTAISDTSKSTNDMNLAALGLGAMSEGVTPLEMAEAYAVFPNGGYRNTPTCYTRVEDGNGRTLLEAKPEKIKVLDEGVAWIMTDVLKSVVKWGIAGNAKVKGIDVGGKTGTTDDRYDIWFDGFTPSYSISLWIGTDENVRMDSASDVAAALWSKIVSQMDNAKKGNYRKRPKNVIGQDGEYYTKGTQPPPPPPPPEPEEEKKDEKAPAEGEAAPAGTDPNAAAPAEQPAENKTD